MDVPSSERRSTSAGGQPTTMSGCRGGGTTTGGGGRKKTLLHFFGAKRPAPTTSADASCTPPSPTSSPSSWSQGQEVMTPPSPPSQPDSPSTPPSPPGGLASIGSIGGSGGRSSCGNSGTSGSNNDQQKNAAGGGGGGGPSNGSSSTTTAKNAGNIAGNGESISTGSAKKTTARKLAPIFAAKKNAAGASAKKRLAPIFVSAAATAVSPDDGNSPGDGASVSAAPSVATEHDDAQKEEDSDYGEDDDGSAALRRRMEAHRNSNRRAPLAPLFATPRTNSGGGIASLMAVTPSTTTSASTTFSSSTSAATASRKRPRITETTVGGGGGRNTSGSTNIRSSSTSATDATTATTTTTTTTNRTQQLYIDLGQSNFAARSICAICGMMTVHGMDEDDAEHERICSDYRNGVTFQGWKNERVVATFPPTSGEGGRSSSSSARIVEIRPSDPAQHRKKVRRVKVIVDQELGFADSSSSARRGQAAVSTTKAASTSDFGFTELDDDDDASLFGKTAFLYVVNKTVVGLCTVEVIRSAHRLLEGSTSNDDDGSTTVSNLHRSIKPTKAIMGVHQLWCHSSHRKGKVATRLVNAARTRLVYGMSVPHDMVAFSSPTVDGLTFAKRYVETETPLIYDCHQR